LRTSVFGLVKSEYRSAESFRGKVLPISSINSSFPPAAPGAPVLLPWEYANVFFHEFGHALHMLCNASEYSSLGSMGVAWDFVELPALINERWLLDHEVLQRFARHYETGAPIPVDLVQALERAAKFDRIFALNLDYLAPAIVDLKLHLMADGEPGQVFDATAFEHHVLTDLGMPIEWDQIMRVTHNVHCFAGGYAAGLYSYLWAEVMAADAAEYFTQSPGGLFDRALAQHWMRTVLSVGAQVPAEQAYRNFRGRSPDPLALLRRFDLVPSTMPPSETAA
ncbi:MAG: M3 family metallopeptidase, partial [Betaproteobacteria bacterium]